MNVRLEYWNGKKFIVCGDFYNDQLAWVSLGGDDVNYRTVDIKSNEVITNKKKLNNGFSSNIDYIDSIIPKPTLREATPVIKQSPYELKGIPKEKLEEMNEIKFENGSIIRTFASGPLKGFKQIEPGYDLRQ